MHYHSQRDLYDDLDGGRGAERIQRTKEVQVSDVKAAAERLKRFFGGETIRSIYGPVLERDALFHADLSCVAKASLAEQDETPISFDDGWLQSVGFRVKETMSGMEATMLLPPTDPEHAITELAIEGDDELVVQLRQGVPDDAKCLDDLVVLTSLPKVLTRGIIQNVCRALGISLEGKA